MSGVGCAQERPDGEAVDGRGFHGGTVAGEDCRRCEFAELGGGSVLDRHAVEQRVCDHLDGAAGAGQTGCGIAAATVRSGVRPGRPRRTSGRLSVVVLNCEMVAWLIRVSRVGGATKTVRRGAALRSGGGVWPARRRAAAARRRMALLTVGGDLEPQPLHAPHRQVVGYPHAGDRAASFLTAVLMQPTAGHCSWPESPPRNRAPVALGGRRHTGGLREFWEPRRHCGSLVPRWFRAAARTRAAVALRRADASAA